MKEHKLSKGGKYASSIMLSLYFSLNDWRGEREKKKDLVVGWHKHSTPSNSVYTRMSVLHVPQALAVATANNVFTSATVGASLLWRGNHESVYA